MLQKFATMGSGKVIDNGILLAEVGRILSIGDDVELLTKGNSMLPFIKGDKDSVRLRKMPSVKVGDIVLGEVAPARYVLHRVVRLEGDTVILMGDGNLRAEESLPRERILGTVVEIIRPSGKRVRPSDGSLWRKLMPFRRIILGIYRRLFI